MALVTKPYTFTAGAVIVAAEHNSNLDTLYNDYNGNITNANLAAGAAVELTKLKLSDDVTFTGDVNFTNSATTDNIIDITGNSLTTGYGLNISSSATNTSARSLVFVTATSTAATGTVGVTVNNQGGPQMRLTGDPTVASPTDGDLWFTGTALNFRNGTSTIDLVSAATVVQQVNAMYSAYATSTTAIPYDDSIPQIGEGAEVMSLAITPTNITNKLKIDVTSNTSCNVAIITTALFQDTSSNALACVGIYDPGQIVCNTHFAHYMTAGTTSATTFRVRIGSNTGATVDFNGGGGARKYGGVLASSITITEIIP